MVTLNVQTNKELTLTLERALALEVLQYIHRTKQNPALGFRTRVLLLQLRDAIEQAL